MQGWTMLPIAKRYNLFTRFEHDPAADRQDAEFGIQWHAFSGAARIADHRRPISG